MFWGRPSPARDDPFARNQAEINKANAYLLKRVTLCAFLNMSVLSAASPFLEGFAESAALYLVSAALTGLFSLYCALFLKRHTRAVLPLFYALLAGLCGYAVALSSFYYPNINGVTIIGIFMLVPMVILDRTWRVNAMFFLYYLISCAFALARKPYALAVDDCVTCGAFMVFGMLIGSYLRGTRLTAIEQKRLLEFQRDRDALTGLPNRRVLFERLERCEDEALGAVMIDIDNFKGYNDRNGHQAGDECLRTLGALFLRFAEHTGVTIYRYGGEEFLALRASGIPMSSAELGQRLVEEVRECDVACERVTISAGSAEACAANLPAEQLIRMADSALYEAKRTGRNRAVHCQDIDRAEYAEEPLPRA